MRIHTMHTRLRKSACWAAGLCESRQVYAAGQLGSASLGLGKLYLKYLGPPSLGQVARASHLSQIVFSSSYSSKTWLRALRVRRPARAAHRQARARHTNEQSQN